MRFNWILGDTADEKLHRWCVDLEYQLRPKIVKFLITNFESLDACSDFSCFHFNVDVIANKITVSEQTPAAYRNAITTKFEQEIGTHFSTFL
ncbi:MULTISPECIES: hypothetical protein [Maribacter]|uniref:Uncharacterized protein n=1 Tax=Maribacter dokdonensis TaxID=320912 RepID=A0A1H4NRH9_9FLAO|nr:MULTISPECIES: hypothetical protein [Maribacter]HAF78234.1 hypothetical protein [Maribacter sp.]APA65050.1 hypothetical protein YQ22_12375 [Maribacter sp. 1_2014MBL_MicDiv]MBU2899916.1 hypothetical protein [Maribacter dokdonensis]MDP2525371.1 hypothetical protein [Maribacter dokdonensis]SEB97820.1 hypothetical protein SAMN05192540_2039 [Maribacter dokdonensis]|tara:strand:+ start:944 stop:1219 length:276 start_codon:yes stop_codon:yes gene_type:complete